EIFLAWYAKENMGSLRRNIFKHGRPGDNRNEPLHRLKDGNYWFHARAGERCCKRWYYCERGAARSDKYAGNRPSIGRAETRDLGTAGHQTPRRAPGYYRCSFVFDKRRCVVYHWPGHCRGWRPVSHRLTKERRTNGFE